MKTIIKKFFYPFFGKKVGQKFFYLLYFLGLKGMNFGGGASTQDSGEGFVAGYALRKLAKDNLVIFDVGGNKGEYTKLWQKTIPQLSSAQFHIFEPSAAAFRHLLKEFGSDSRVVLNNVALSDEAGEAMLYADFDGSGLASLASRDLSHAGVELGNRQKITTQTLDDYCQEKDIERIDFLKLDVEGFELAVLKGGRRLLSEGRIKFIQFEFGGTDIDTRVFFKDFYKLLNQQYKICRILKNGLVEIEKYSELNEIFLTTNYLAELK